VKDLMTLLVNSKIRGQAASPRRFESQRDPVNSFESQRDPVNSSGDTRSHDVGN